MKKSTLFFGTLSTFVLAACTNSATSTTTTASTSSSEGAKLSFAETVTNEGTAISGGVLKYGLISESPISGVLNAVYYENATDAEVLTFIDEGLINSDENSKYTTGGIGDLTYDLDKKTITVTIKENIKWSDGTPLTIDDYIYAFEVIGHKDYSGIRYDTTMKAIEGIEAYHSGEATTISGITKNNDYSVTFKVSDITPSMLQAGGFWTSAIPKHTLKAIAIADQPASDAVRKNPVGLGAFRVTNLVAGESVTTEANPYYWQGTPKLSGVIIDVVNSTNSADEFKNGNYDLMGVQTATSIYDSFKELNNATLLGKWANVYNYLGFKLGTWNNETDTATVNPNAKMANKALRQAMGYALDLDEFATSFYGSLRARATTLFSPTFENLFDKTLTGYTYDVEKAKKLLDDAGYKDTNGDGLREDSSGNALTINFAFMAGGDSEAQAQYYIQQWKAVGLNVQLTNGRLIEFNTFYEMVEADDPNIDVYAAAWGVGGDPSPDNLWGNNASNYTRFTSEKQDAMFKAMNSADMLDETKKAKAYKEWQAYAMDEAYAIPTLYRVTLTAVNKRVKNFDITSGDSNWSRHLHKLELTADAPIAHK